MQIKLKNGMVKGVVDKESNIVFFGGIPYAAPPVGELRWKAPQPAAPWEDVLDCSSFRNACPQYTPELAPGERMMFYTQEYFLKTDFPMSEDCLYLNIWAPADAADRNPKLPVLFIIHGGGFMAGSGAVPILNGKNMAKEGIIVVTINYRLGVFGFLSHPLLSAESDRGISGNYGLMDQIYALKWVQENIEAFGGNPAKVTLAGESAGAYSVSILYQSSLAKGLFSQVVAESGAWFGDNGLILPKDVKKAEAAGEKMLSGFSVSTVEEMRQIPSEQLINTKSEERFPFCPIIDEYIWKKDYVSVLSRHEYNDTALLIGSNADEGSSITDPMITKEDFCRLLDELYGQDAEKVKKLYIEEASQFPQTAFEEERDRAFEWPMYLWAKLQNKYGQKPVYLYYYTREAPGTKFGAFHSSELVYFYANQEISPLHWETTDRQLGKKMNQYLMNFVKTGSPNEDGLPLWQEYNVDSDKVMCLGDEIKLINKTHKEAMTLLEKLSNKELKN